MALDLTTLQSLEGTNAAVLNDAENTIVRVSFLETEETRLGNEIIYKNLYVVAANKNGKRYSYVVPVTGPSLKRIEEYGLTEAIDREQQNAFSSFDREYQQIAEDIYYDEEDNGLITFDVEVYTIESKFRGGLNIRPSIEVSEEPDEVSTPPTKPKQTLQEQSEERQQEAANEEVAIAQSQTSTVDDETIENATPKTLKAFGIAKLPLLLLILGNKIKDIINPSLQNIQDTYLKDITPQDACPDPAIIQKIKDLRNNVVNQLNKVGDRLDIITKTLIGLSTFLSFLEGVIKGIDVAKIAAKVAALFNPVLAAALPPLLNTLNSQKQATLINNKGESRLVKLNAIIGGAALVAAMIGGYIKIAIALLNSIDAILNKCSPDGLIPVSKTIQDIAILQTQAENTQNKTTYNGFIIEIEEVPYTDTVTRRRAIGKNNSGIVLIQTELSFTTDNQTLINELKFIIDRDNLKAY